MSDIRDTLPTGGADSSAATSPSTYPATTAAGSSGSTGSGIDTAKQEAANVAGTAKDEAKHVASTAKEEVKEVGREARTQISRLYDEARGELASTAADRQDRLAQGLRAAGGELRGMADSSTDGGVATDVVRQVSQRLDGVASWLGARDPGAVLGEVKRYARRRPVVFLAFAALAGVAVGRLTRSLAAGAPDSDETYQRQLTAGSGYSATGTTGYSATGTPVYDATVTPGVATGTPDYGTAGSPTLRSTSERGTDARPGELG